MCQKCERIDLPSRLITQLFVALLGGKKQLLIGYWWIQILSYSEFIIFPENTWLGHPDWQHTASNRKCDLPKVSSHVCISLTSLFLIDISEMRDSLSEGVTGLIWCYRKGKTSAEALCGSRGCLLVVGWITTDFMLFTSVVIFLFFPIAPFFCHWA